MSLNGNKDDLQNDVVDRLLEDLRKLDQVVQHSSSPSVETWEGIVKEQWKLTKRKRIGETILFCMVALLLISGGYTFIFSAPWLLAVIQVIGLAVAVGILVFDRSTHREERS
jgi:ABC-type multidrug transport system fused ATPase/permease subunit